MLPVCYWYVFENTRMHPCVTRLLPVSVYPCGVLVKILGPPLNLLNGENSTWVEWSLAFPSYPYPVPQMELNFWLSPCAKQSQNPHSQSGPTPLYQVNWPIRMMGNWKRIFGNLLSPLGAQNKDIT